MASAVNPITGSSSSTSTSAAAASAAAASSTGAPTEQMFLQLLVAQLQNQDPLNPTDSTQFVSQLAQFSELENVIGIRGDIESYWGQSQGATGSGTTDTSTTPTTAETPATTSPTTATTSPQTQS
jgi:flagellar basal-body rod modification protein FlgD